MIQSVEEGFFVYQKKRRNLYAHIFSYRITCMDRVLSL